MANLHETRPARSRPRTFRGVALRGLTFLLPPILTVVVILWVVSTGDSYVLEPGTIAAREASVWALSDVRERPADAKDEVTIVLDGRNYTRLVSGQYIPSELADWWRRNLRNERMPTTGQGVYREYVQVRYLQPQLVIPVFLCVFILLLYVLGKFLAAEISGLFDWGILHLPIVRKVYAAVKQVTDFVFGDNLGENQQVAYKRVVAIEYPRPGLWSIGLLMGEAVLDVSAAANEPCVTVMLPTS